MLPSSPLNEVDLTEGDKTRQACVLLLDTSGSMQGERIAELNAGLQTFKEAVRQDSLVAQRIDVAIITFDSEVKIVKDFGPIETFEFPILTAQSQTFMGKGILEALQKIAARKADYDNHGIASPYRPWLFMITDGLPEGEPNEVIEEARAQLQNAVAQKKVAIHAVGVGDVDLSRLSEITGQQPLRLQGTNFQELFLWLSRSVSTVSQSRPGETIQLPPPNWAVLEP